MSSIAEIFETMEYGPAPESASLANRWLDERDRTMKLFIAGEWREPRSGERFETTNPANGLPGKRHPTICDGVIIGSGAQVLGPIMVGPRARIGANAVVTKDVPEGATMIGIPARSTLVNADDYSRDFVPYGTPCQEMYDPATQKLEILKCEVEQLRKRLAQLTEERDGLEQDEQERGRA